MFYYYNKSLNTKTRESCQPLFLSCLLALFPAPAYILSPPEKGDVDQNHQYFLKAFGIIGRNEKGSKGSSLLLILGDG
jgi:hypothetical protein